MLILSVATDALAAPSRPKPPAPLTSRSVAHRVLLRCARDGAFADRALSAELDAAPELPAGGRRHATELVYGVMRNSALLDHHLGQLTNLTRADLKTRTILRIGAHEELHLRTADHAALNEAVALGKNRVQRSYVNGVLRSLVRGRDADRIERAFGVLDRMRATGVDRSYAFYESVIRMLAGRKAATRVELRQCASHWLSLRETLRNECCLRSKVGSVAQDA